MNSLHSHNLLRPFQAYVVSAIIRKYNGRALLALEMGLGKTICAIEYIRRANPSRTVIVCPASLKLNWKSELEKWGYSGAQVIKSKEPFLSRIVILSYEMAAKRALEIAMEQPECMILDESHYIKNHKAIRTKQLVPLCRRARHCLLLTGTPILNRPVELFSQLAALNVNLGLKSFFEFARRYCAAHKTRFGWDFNGSSNVAELNKKLVDSCMIRLRKDEVLKELPAKARCKIVVEGVGKRPASGLAALCQEALKQTRFNVGAALEKLRGMKNDVSSVLFKAYAEIGAAKLSAASDIVAEAATQAPIVAFAHHRAVVHGIATHAVKAGLKVAVIDGDTPIEARQKAVEEFQAGNLNAVICSITAASTGLTLTKARDMFICELPFSPGLALQAEDRIHRIGQSAGVLIRYLVAAGTLDEALWKMLDRKAGTGHAIIDGARHSEFAELSEVTHGNHWDVVSELLKELALENDEPKILVA